MNRRNSEAVWSDKTGMWTIRVQVDGQRKQFSTTMKGRKGKHFVEAKADEWLEKSAEDLLFSEAWQKFLDYTEQHGSVSNWKKHEMMGRIYLLPAIKKKRLSQITPINWQSCIDLGASRGLTRRSCTNIRSSITAFIKFARRSRWDIDRLEEGDLTIPRSAAPQKEKTVLQPDAVRLLFNDPYIIHYNKKKLSPYSYAWQFFVTTGLRRGELCGLRNEDIVGNVLTVSRSLNTLGEITTGKNDNARRTIELSPTAMTVLEHQRQMLKDNGIISPWVFPDQYGGRPDPNKLYDHWRSWCTQHGLKISIHELRHTFISLNRADLPLELMKATVGHSSAMDTFGIYGHDIDGDRTRAAAIVENVFQRILND